MTRKDCRLSSPAVICSLGGDHDTIMKALATGQRGLTNSERYTPGRVLALGDITTALVSSKGWPVEHTSRNNRLIATALAALSPQLDEALKHHAPDRIAVVMGTSTSGISETEAAIARTGPGNDFDEHYRYAHQELGAPAHFIRAHLGLSGPAWTISTACSSGARALSAARRLLLSGQADAVIAGGADTLCHLTVHGFDALGAISDTPCQPFTADRCGINIGEAAALFIVTREPGGIQLTGYGESSDAHHISAPAPDGHGAIAAIRQALDMAGRTPGDIDYLNLHGTATTHNDAMEALALHDVFGSRQPPASSTKALTGHTLGAAGALEAAFCWLALEHGFLPRHVHDQPLDASLMPLSLVDAGITGQPRVALSNAFAFGGNNAALVLERHDA
ncbi:beta-ketoacyl-ACP synthase [Kushneria marisflavi]|uniref:Beta-ketoacyl-[acyl-carrier-protein] synthase II n=1 Tax=Kushneria marisflavi TaxID=157779 RepID=A0A240UQT7_9GAMM|nr:beta-ketoacyl-ACP synthase [Kushneria marisflavi]ART63851.1 beta-ketoacyl-[acyl-carrier-protein] synthase II [Kushneria marisflavi]RKD85556.1 3-oxoacyl-[acyl-carrier-protein] synthase-1 [Kushneria marisflavi]